MRYEIILSAPYFLATKLEAFIDRGGDYRLSHDFEDVIYIIDNRTTIVDEIRMAESKVAKFLKEELGKVISSPFAQEFILAQIHPLIATERYPMVLDKIIRITRI